MDLSFQTPGAFVHYYPPPCAGFLASGSPSPPLSLCSEPIIQIPIPDSPSGTPGAQLRTPGIQLLNTTMVDARKKKNVSRGLNLAPRMEQLDMASFFQSASPFPDQLSDSEAGSVRGGSAPESPQFRYSPPAIHFSQLQNTPFHYQPLDLLFQYPQPELQRKIAFIQLEKQNQQAHKYNNVGSFSPLAWGNLAVLNQVTYPPTATVKKHLPAHQPIAEPPSSTPKERVERRNKPKRKPSAHVKKKELITTMKTNALKKDRTKQNVKVRKQRVHQKNKLLHKTELCTHWSLTSTCTYKSKCYFAHGIDELRKKTRLCNFKTRPCVDCPPEKGRCSFGARCNYCHPGEAIRRPVGSTYFDVDYYKDLKNEFGHNDYPFGIFV